MDSFESFNRENRGEFTEMEITTISVDEMFECEAAVQNSPIFKEVLKKHYGDIDSSLVMVDIWSAGNYGSEEDKNNRLTRPLCFLRKEKGENGYAHPLEGKGFIVNLRRFNSWPRYVAEKLDCVFVNNGYCGIGNHDIYSEVKILFDDNLKFSWGSPRKKGKSLCVTLFDSR
jgi:hypothetical protein